MAQIDSARKRASQFSQALYFMSIKYKEDINSLKRKLLFSLLLLVVAIIIPILSFNIPAWAPSTVTDASWFQRSGSVVVIIAVLAEFVLFKTYDFVSPSEAAYSVPFDTPGWYKHIYNIAFGIAHTMLIVGTVIPVDYDGPLKVSVNMINPTPPEDILSRKLRAWEYEQEERVFIEGAHFVNIKLKEILVGSRMSTQDFSLLSSLVEKDCPEVPLVRTK